jgi:tetratricopeptide (TPR) repeat protein
VTEIHVSLVVTHISLLCSEVGRCAIVHLVRNTLAPVGKKLDLSRYFAREPVMLTVISALAVVFFLGVTGLSRVYRAQQERLGNRWFTRGRTELNAGHFGGAVSDFRAALLYSRDNYSYQLSLAEALVGSKRSSEAQAYLINLWDREPENGFVNRELARICAQNGQTDKALRYYHNAIYATWPDEQEVERRQTRLELINYLLKINGGAQAQSELIALAANLGNHPAEQTQVGDLFVRAKDYEDALVAFQMALKSDRHSVDAVAGAGLATFELGRYNLAERYLKAAVTANPKDAESVARLKTTELVLRMDPFQRNLPDVRRSQIVIDAFAAAGQRLKSCNIQNASLVSDGGQTVLAEVWQSMKPRITPWELRRDPDLLESAMDLVFRIERETGASCGAPSETDTALLLVGKSHEGS